MNRNVYLALITWLLGIVSVASAQDLGAKPQVPEDAFSVRELIAWSSLQKPTPTPQPLPPPDKPISQPDQQPRNTVDPQSVPRSQDGSVATFVGKIVKTGTEYALQVDNATTYRLAAGGEVAQFENKNVKIEGVLDINNKTIRVIRITLI